MKKKQVILATLFSALTFGFNAQNIGSSTESYLYTTTGGLRINGDEGQTEQHNTLINPEKANVGIGMYKPLGKLDIDLGSLYHTKQAGVRITVPQAVFVGGPSDNINKSIFQIRKHAGNQLNGFTTQFILDHQGSVGVGIDAPDSKLHVHNGRIQISGNNTYGGPMIVFGGQNLNGTAPYGEWSIEQVSSSTSSGVTGLNFWKPYQSSNSSNYNLFLADNGKVSIGIDPNSSNALGGNYKLYVADGILTERVKVALQGTGQWADYVFEEDYELLQLEEVEKFINKNGHLPNVPSAQQVVDAGIDVAQMDAKLLEKIEELTLYVIELKKEIDQLKK